MPKTLNRRDFIRISSFGLGGLAAANPIFDWLSGSVMANESLQETIKRIPTYCEVCFWKFAGWVHLNEKGDIWWRMFLVRRSCISTGSWRDKCKTRVCRRPYSKSHL